MIYKEEGYRLWRPRPFWVPAIACAVLVLSLLPMPLSATTLKFRNLAEIVEFSSAVVRGTIVSQETLATPEGRPWTIYTLLVDEVMAGDVDSLELHVRCLGGPNNDGSVTALVGAPILNVGDRIIAGLHQKGLCQFSGFESGVLWEKVDASGKARLVNYEGRALAALSERNLILSELLVPAAATSGVVSNVKFKDNSNRGLEALPPPAADAIVMVAELRAFAVAHLTKNEVFRSTRHLDGLPALTQDKAPEALEDSK